MVDVGTSDVFCGLCRGRADCAMRSSGPMGSLLYAERTMWNLDLSYYVQS